jgi:transposase
MEHIGIDLGGRDSQMCIRNGAGEIVEEMRCRTDRLVPMLARRAPARVVVKTCTEAFRIAARMQQHGHDVRVVAATLVLSLGVGQRGVKNDQRDARTLSEVSCRIELPSVHIPASVSQEVKAICVSREALIKARTAARQSRAKLCAVARGSAAARDSGELAQEGATGTTGRRRGSAGPSRSPTPGPRDIERANCRRPRRQFDDDFKAQAVRLVLDEGKSIPSVAHDLDLTESSLRKWVEQARADRSDGKTGLTTAEREKLARLRKEVRVLREEREILRKAAAFFATERR